MSRNIVFVSASPSPSSRSTFVARATASMVQRAGWSPVFFSLADFDPADVFLGRSAAESVTLFLEAVKAASGVVLSTPVYKASYTGSLKAIIDLVPPDALFGKSALGISTGKQSAHGAGVDSAYRALFAFFRTRTQGTLFVHDDELQLAEGAGRFVPAAESRVEEAARAFVQSIAETTAAAAHP